MRVLAALLIGLVAGAFCYAVLAGDLPHPAVAGMPIAAVEGSPCAARVERAVGFTAPNAQDLMTVQSSGPSCSNLVATIIIRTAAGHVVFAYAARIDALMDPKINPVAANGVKAVLNDYAAIAEGGARALPAWREGAPEVENAAPYGMFIPEAGNALYRRVRAANAPLLRVRAGRDSGLLFAYLPEIDESEPIARYAL